MALPAVLAFSLFVPALAAGSAPSAAPNNVIVRFEAGAEAAERAHARSLAGTEFERGLGLSGLQVVDPEPGVSVAEAIELLERSDDVLYAEPDAPRSATGRPNDSLFAQQWGLHNTGQRVGGVPGRADADIDLQEGWDLGTGNTDVTVGVLDSGIDLDHPDLAQNIRSGWDLVDRDQLADDPNGHGTHVAGTIGAAGNNGRGVAGVAWRTGLVPLRVLDAEGQGRVSDIVAAYAYAARTRLRIVNASFAGSSFSQAEYDAIRAIPDTLVVTAAGNDGRDNDVTGTYPCNNPLPNLICVAATDQHDGLAAGSSHGRRTVDLGAPGQNVMSTLTGGRYGLMSGTSMAAPHVAGTAALIWSRWPRSSVAAVRAALLAGADPTPSLAGRTVTGGRLNALRALANAPNEAGYPPDAGVDPAREQDATSPAPGANHDLTPLGLSAKLSRRARVHRLLRRGVPVRARCSEACTVRLEFTISRRSAASIEVVRPNIVVARSDGRLARGRSTLIRVRLAGRGRRLLKRAGARRLTLRARAVDAAGNAATVKRSLRLRR